METIQVSETMVIEIFDRDPPALHLIQGNDIVVMWPDQIQNLREALAEAGGVAAAMAAGEHGKAVIV